MTQDEQDQYLRDNTLAGAAEKLNEALADLWNEMVKAVKGMRDVWK